MAKPPVVLLPGAFGQGLVYWNAWQRFLERDGYRVHAATFPRLTFSDLRHCARSLEARVEEVLAAEGADSVALVAHSMGGLVARWYLTRLGGARRTSHLTCLGTPHRGTWAAATAPLLAGTRQLLPGSPFLVELNDPRRDHGGVPILNVWSKWDGVVVPSGNALFEAAGVENRALPYAGHWGLLVSRRAYAWARDALEAAAPAA